MVATAANLPHQLYTTTNQADLLQAQVKMSTSEMVRTQSQALVIFYTLVQNAAGFQVLDSVLSSGDQC
jgi:hypothetical protein